MKGGTIVLLSGAEIRTGAWMNRGTIISLKPLHMMPTFAHAADMNPVFVSLLARHLKQFGVDLPGCRRGHLSPLLRRPVRLGQGRDSDLAARD